VKRQKMKFVDRIKTILWKPDLVVLLEMVFFVLCWTTPRLHNMALMREERHDAAVGVKYKIYPGN
jgi:hypothetical protein